MAKQQKKEFYEKEHPLLVLEKLEDQGTLEELEAEIEEMMERIKHSKMQSEEAAERFMFRFVIIMGLLTVIGAGSLIIINADEVITALTDEI